MSEVAIPLRLKYRKGYAYKNQKSPTGNSSKRRKRGVSGPSVKNNLPGSKVKMLNFGAPMLCAGTGKQLASRGMVVKHNGEYYSDFAAIR